MDVLFYSNYCKHSAKLLGFLTKHGIAAKLNCICVDRRVREPNGQTVILTETGKRINLPINVNSVPSLLLISQKYQVVVGDEIYNLFKNVVDNNTSAATQGNGEPLGFVLGSSGGSSFGESYDESVPAANSNAGAMSNMVSAQHNNTFTINTPQDTYISNKIGAELSVDTLKQKWMSDMAPAPFLGDIASMPGNMATMPNMNF